MSAEILVLDRNWSPHRWIDVEEAILLESKDLVVDHKGSIITVYHGGKNRITGLQSTIETSSIIVIDGLPNPRKFKEPSLTNGSLFQRDRHVCANCTRVYRTLDLTRDHIHPTSKGGKDIWMNVITACRSCNSLKGDTLPGHKLPNGEHGPFGPIMTIAYLPYVPCKSEHMLMRGRNIKADQMEFLIGQITNPNSRFYQH